jgi:diguanylate cyclase (GGDEF)-like protein
MSKSVRNFLLAALFILQAVTVVTIVLLNRVSSEPVLVDQMNQMMDKVADESVERTEAHLRPAADAAALTEDLVDQGFLDPTDVGQLQRYFLSQLRVSPQLDGLFVGYPDGGLVYVSHDDSRDEDGFRAQVIEVDGEVRTNTISWLAADGTETASERDDADPFDPRTRPWYEAATATGGLIWTKPYVFYNYLTPGVTTAAPIESDDGELIAVFGVDTALAELSEFVADLDVSANGTAYLVDTSGGLLAYRDLDAVVRESEDENEEYRLAQADEVSDALVEEAHRTLEDADLEPGERLESAFSVDGQASRAVFVPLSERDDWYVAVAAPERDFVGRILDGQRDNALLAVGIGLAVIVLSIPFVRWVGRLFQRTHDRATTDALTKLVNRRQFEESLRDEVVRARRQGHPLSVALIDVDFFKQINDTHGHGVGDEALIAVADGLRRGVRETDVVSRLGGDEFAVLLLETDVPGSAEILERIRAQFDDEPATTSAGPVPITLTFGVAGLAPGDADGDALVARADAALYVAKEGGRNRVATPDGLVDRTSTAGATVAE